MKKLILSCMGLIFFSLISGQTNAQTMFNHDEIIEDINFLLNTLNECHPTFSQKLSNKSFQKKIDKIKNSINQPITKYDFFKLMQPIVAVDSHTSLRFTGKIPPDIQTPLFPFKIIIHNNLIYIKENLSQNNEISRGMIIDSINGVSSPKIINEIGRYIPADKDIASPEKISEVFHLFYRLAYGNFKYFNIVLDDNGNKIQAKVNGVRFKTFKEVLVKQFEYRIIEDDIAFLRICDFWKPDYFTNFIDSVFCDLQKKDIKHLIIDKREGGGVTSLADTLLSYLTDTRYNKFAKQKIKISESNQDFIQKSRSKGTVKEGYLVIKGESVIPTPRDN